MLPIMPTINNRCMAINADFDDSTLLCTLNSTESELNQVCLSSDQILTPALLAL